MARIVSTTTVPPIVLSGPRNGITIEKIEAEIKKKPLTKLKSPKNEKGKHGITIEGFDFRGLDVNNQKQLNLSDCQNVTVRRCIFGQKTTKGVGLNVVGSKTRNITIEYCIFENMTFTADNGGEPLRLGLSDYSGITYNCLVRNCIFRNLRSDPETISVKSCGNVIEDNFFVNNKSNVTVRHGGFTTIRHNLIINGGGIRIHGYGNRVEYNCIGNNLDTESLAPIQLRYGDAEKDPNFTDVKTPSEKAKDVDPVYARTVDTRVENNEFKNCRKTVIELKKNGNLKPQGTIQNNNKAVDKFSFEQEPLPPTPPTPPPTPEFLTCQVDGTKDATVKEEKYVLCATDKTKVDNFIASVVPPAPPTT